MKLATGSTNPRPELSPTRREEGEMFYLVLGVIFIALGLLAAWKLESQRFPKWVDLPV